MPKHIVERTTESETKQIVCRNMRDATVLFDQVKDHISTSQTQLIAYGKVVRTHTSEKSVLTPLQNLKLTKHI
jgi:hypothetical protein